MLRLCKHAKLPVGTTVKRVTLNGHRYIWGDTYRNTRRQQQNAQAQQQLIHITIHSSATRPVKSTHRGAQQQGSQERRQGSREGQAQGHSQQAGSLRNNTHHHSKLVHNPCHTHYVITIRDNKHWQTQFQPRYDNKTPAPLNHQRHVPLRATHLGHLGHLDSRREGSLITGTRQSQQ